MCVHARAQVCGCSSCIGACVCAYVCVCVFMCVCVHVCMLAYMCVWVQECIHVHTYIYLWSHTFTLPSLKKQLSGDKEKGAATKGEEKSGKLVELENCALVPYAESYSG